MIPSKTSTLPHYFRVEDYQGFVLDFPINFFLREGIILLAKPEMWRLTSSQLQSVLNYITKAESTFHHHKIQEKLDILIRQWASTSQEE